jgi:hypothetical protein
MVSVLFAAYSGLKNKSSGELKKMKKIINGSLYNTETAKCIGAWEPNGYDQQDFNYLRERLYKTRAGKYFLHGEGHGNSRYGEWHGNTGGWGEQIRPYTPQEARQWAEEHLNADDYAAEFGEPAEASDGRVTLNLTVPPEIKARLEKLKSETGKSISQLVTEKFQ